MGKTVTGERVTVLYGTDTGNAEMVAKNFQFELKRRGMKAKCLSLNDVSIGDLPDESKILAIVATAGQGEMPKSAVKFWQDMETFLVRGAAGFRCKFVEHRGFRRMSKMSLSSCHACTQINQSK